MNRTPTEQLENSLYDHVFGSGSPCGVLLDHGVFPEGWVGTYLKLVAELTECYKGQLMLPRRVVWAVQFASWYLPMRYEMWCKTTGATNEATVSQMATLRTPSELFVYGTEHEAGDHIPPLPR